MTTDTLDLPTIADPAPETAQPAGVPATVDLKKVDLQDVALAQFGDWRADVADARKNLSTLVLDLSIPARIAEAKSLRERVINAPRAQVRKVSKALKSRLTAVSKAVGAEEEAAVAAYDEAEKLITPQIEAADQRIEEERLEKQRAAELRIHNLKLAVDANLDPWMDRCDEDGMTAARVQAGMTALDGLAIPPELADVDGYWTERKSITRAYMERRRLALAQAELEAEQARLRAEAQRVAGIQQRIAEIQAAATGHDKASSVDLIEAGLIVDALTISEDVYQEFTALAQAAKAATLATLKALADAALAREEAEEEAADAQAAEAARQQEEEAARMRAQVPAANVATAAATEGKAEDPEPGTLEAAPVEALGVTAQHAQEGVADNPLQPQPAAPFTAGDGAAVCEAVDEAVAAVDDSTAPGVIATQPTATTDPRDEFVALVMTAFDCKFPTHPKPSQEWWARVRAAGEALTR